MPDNPDRRDHATGSKRNAVFLAARSETAKALLNRGRGPERTRRTPWSPSCDLLCVLLCVLCVLRGFFFVVRQPPAHLMSLLSIQRALRSPRFFLRNSRRPSA